MFSLLKFLPSRATLHTWRLRWQYSCAWKHPCALLPSGEWRTLERNQKPTEDGWLSVFGERIPSEDIRVIVGSGEFGYD